MDAKERAELKDRIDAEVEETKLRISELKELTKPIAPENAIGRVSRMDAINNKSINEAALREAEQKLKKLNYALTRVDHPDFGVCSRCGNPIPAARLILMPQSVQCVRCAR